MKATYNVVLGFLLAIFAHLANGESLLLKESKKELFNMMDYDHATELIDLIDHEGDSSSDSLKYALRHKLPLRIIQALVAMRKPDINQSNERYPAWVSKRDEQKYTAPLSLAIENYSLTSGVIQYLVEQGADVNHIDVFRNQTPLIVAALRDEAEGKTSIVHYLLCQGADLNDALRVADRYHAHAKDNAGWEEMANKIMFALDEAQESTQEIDC